MSEVRLMKVRFGWLNPSEGTASKLTSSVLASILRLWSFSVSN